MQTITINKLKSELEDILKEIAAGESISVTAGGKEIARISPPPQKNKAAYDKLEKIKKSAKVHDVISPLDQTWNATR